MPIHVAQYAYTLVDTGDDEESCIFGLSIVMAKKTFCTLQEKRTTEAQITLVYVASPALNRQYSRKKVLHPIKYRRMNPQCQTD